MARSTRGDDVCLHHIVPTPASILQPPRALDHQWIISRTRDVAGVISENGLSIRSSSGSFDGDSHLLHELRGERAQPPDQQGGQRAPGRRRRPVVQLGVAPRVTAGTCVLFDHFQRRKPTAPLKAAREKLLSAVFSLSLAFATLSFVSDRRRLVRASESSSTAAPSRRGARPPRCRWRGRRANGRRTARPDRDIDRAPGVARGQGGQQARTLLPGPPRAGSPLQSESLFFLS